MRRHTLYIFLLLIMALNNVLPVQAQQTTQYALYNYRNDGDFNAWLNNDIDSITYSRIDTLGIEHDDIVVQEVWTPDSIYRIPLEAIDSLGFQAPKTQLKNDVFIIRESHIPYTIDVDSLSIIFASTIPTTMIPSVGQVVVSETFDEPYEEGFVGRVVNIINSGNSIKIICEDATLFDIYDQLIAVGKLKSVSESSQNGKKLLPKRLLGFDDVDKSGEYTFEIGMLTLKHNKFEWVSAEYTPEIKFEYILYIHKDDPIHVKFLLSGKHDLALNVDYKVLEKLSTESKDEIWISDVPLPYFYGFKPIFKIGLFYKVGGKAHVTGKIPVTISHDLGFEYHGKGGDITNVNILKSFDMNFGEPQLDLKIDGYMSGGLCADLGVKFLHQKIASLEAILKMGPKLTTSFDLSANDIVNDPTAYSLLKNTKLKTEFDIGLDAKYRILTKKARILPGKGWPGVKSLNQYKTEEDYPKGEISWSWPLFECFFLPEFTHSFSSYNNRQAVFSTTTSRELFIPVKIGAQIDNNGKIETIMQPNSYWSEEIDAKKRTFDTKFENIAPGNSYTSKPVVEILGCRLTASPSASVDTNIKQLYLKGGTKETVTISDGNISFTVKSENPKIVTCSIDKNDKSKLIVNAIKQGIATIVLTDTKTNHSSMIEVTVTNEDVARLQLSTTSLTFSAYSCSSVQIISGSGSYSIESVIPSGVVKAEIIDNTIISIEAYTVGTATITVKDTKSGQTASIEVKVIAIDIPAEAVDLGLPSGTLWANMNVGATKPEEYGGYFAWGETMEKSTYTWENYIHCDGTEGTCHDLDSDISSTQNDVAHVKWGGNWCMPTLDDIKELLDNCMTKWTTRNGVKGCKFTSKKNGNSIFLPAAGYSWNGEMSSVGSSGYYRSSTQYPSKSTNAFSLYFRSGSANWNNYYRGSGQSVRPVMHSASTSAIKVETAEIDFGEVPIGETRRKSLTILNNGDQQVEVKVAKEGDGVFEFSDALPWDDYITIIIPAGERRDVSISFRASASEEYTGNLIVTSDGIIEGSYTIPLKGKGVEVEEDTSFRLSENVIDVYINTENVVSIMNGSGEYEVVNENPDIVDYDINGIHVAHAKRRTPTEEGHEIKDDLWWITAKKIGNATLILTDKQTKQELTLKVKVIQAPTLTIAKNDIELNVGDKEYVEILTGSGWYEVKTDNSSVVSVSKASITVGGGGGRDDEYTSYSGIYAIIEALSAGNAVVTVKDLSSGKTAGINVKVMSSSSSPAEAIDLGLPSGTKWASCNVGATKPEEYGGYYAWGETEEKDVYSEDTYQYYQNGSYVSLGSDISGTEYDVAHVKWGGNWVMPTHDEQMELLSNCTSEWTTLNGVNGRKFTGPNGNSIFLPAAGGRWYGDLYHAGEYGYYWSSAQNPDISDDAYGLGIDSGYAYWYYYYNRYGGLSVRPVVRN